MFRSAGYMHLPSPGIVFPQKRKLRFARNATVTYYCVELEQDMVGRIVELDHANLSYTIRRESGVLDIVDDRHVAGSQPTF